jgi:hypothetical protein
MFQLAEPPFISTVKTVYRSRAKKRSAAASSYTTCARQLQMHMKTNVPSCKDMSLLHGLRPVTIKWHSYRQDSMSKPVLDTSVNIDNLLCPACSVVSLLLFEIPLNNEYG